MLAGERLMSSPRSESWAKKRRERLKLNPSTPREIWLLAAQAAAISELANANRNEIVAGALNVSNLKDYVAMVQQGG